MSPITGLAKLICQKHFRPGNRVGVFIWKNFHPGCRDLGCRNRDLGNRAGPPSHMNTSIFYKGNRSEARSRKPGQPGQPGTYEEAFRNAGEYFRTH